MLGEFNNKVISVFIVKYIKGTMQKPNKEEEPRKSIQID